jgi:hypothetical protein
VNEKPIASQSLADKAEERDRQASGRTAATVAGWLVGIGLFVSAALTIFYLTLLVQAAAGLPDPYGYLFGLLVGIVAIVPAELALIIWRSRLDSDQAITNGQRATAVTAIILAGVFSAATTGSFFSYFLPQLFPPSYLTIAPAINVIAIVGSWIIFLLAIVAYSVFSRQTQQNLAQAKAQQGIFDARMDVLRSAGEAIRAEAENLITAMDEHGIFGEDARRLIISSLGMDDNRLTPNLPTRPRAIDQETEGGPAESRFDQFKNRLTGSSRSGHPDMCIVHRQVPGGDRKPIGPPEDFAAAEHRVYEDGAVQPPGTIYWIIANGQDIDRYERHRNGVSRTPSPSRPHPNGRPAPAEQTAPPGPDDRANQQPAYQVWLHNGRRAIHMILETYDWKEADTEARQAADAAPPEHYIIIKLGDGRVARYDAPVVVVDNGRPTQRP